MAVNDGGGPPILAQKHLTQPSALAPEWIDLGAQSRIRRIEADDSHDVLLLIAAATDRLRSRLPP